MLLNIRPVFCLVMGFVLLVTTGCEKESIMPCEDQATTAFFQVNGTDFNALDQQIWLRDGMQHSLQFMQQMPNGNQHVVILIFKGDTAGNYPLLGINSIHRAAYFAPGVNGTTFPDTVQPGTLVITNFDQNPDCLSGTYAFAVDTLHISGAFQSLRSD